MENEFNRREKKIVRPISEKLARRNMGGLSLMRKICDEVESKCSRSCRSALEMNWSRSGEWRMQSKC